MKKKALATCLAGTMLLGSVTTSALAVDVNQLVDVEKSDWFYPYVEYVAGKDYMKGISSTQFAPMMEMNRAMFVTVLYRLDNPKGVSSQSNFVDVPSDTWYTQAVNWAAANKIVNGIGGDKFAPDDSITREQICTIVARYVEYRAKKDGKTYKTTEKEKTFPDADQIGEYAKEAVKKCQMWGLIEGNEKGYMNPLNTATRAEVAAIVQRLDDLLASGQSSGGGGGGGVSSTSAAYTVKATLDVPDSLDTRKLDLVSNYNVTVYSNGTINGDKDLGGVITDLTAGENETALRNALTEALSRVKGKSTTQTINGQVVTLSIDDNGVITASMSVKVTDITGSKARASQEELEALINELQKGGEMTFTADDLDVISDLLDKVGQVADKEQMSDQQIQDKIDEIVAEKPELEQVVKGLTVDAIRDAAVSYGNELTEIKEKVEVLNPGESVKIDKEPVVMSVAMDLGEYLQMAVDKFTASRDKAIDRLESELGLTPFTDEQQAAAEALYDVNNPTNYMTNNGDGTLTLKDTDTYFTVFQNNVTNGVAFYDSLNGDAAFYQSLLERLENKYQEDGYDISYAGSVETMAALMGDPDGIMVDENKAFRDGMTFELKVTASEDTYKNWVDLITGKWSQAGNFLPGEMPSALANLLGDYTVTVTIDKQ
ncbi:S-layer homology domain-containing protein [Flavonifractor plautii]|uniref:S-layer homology domain-containing protein n=1 Tax=Flavonifractor plautii TaxID=292800 RepID=UPI00195D5E59|nr:S-layer homology domain-containing protein [Flavonifractor plautii]